MKRFTQIPTQAPSGAPLLIGEHPALDFLNSVLAPHGTTLDHLHNGDAMRAWLHAAQVLPQFSVATLTGFSVAQMERLARDARALREGFRQVLLLRKQAGVAGLSTEDLACINTWLVRSPAKLTLAAEGVGQALFLRRVPPTPAALLAELAASCADLLVNYPQQQIRKCENPACTLWFNDSKSGPRRHWCTMAICGNRMKVAAHRARLRSTK